RVSGKSPRRSHMLLNRPRAIEFMRQCGLDALVATSMPNITYFSDYYFWLDPVFREYWMAAGASSNLGQGYAVLPLTGEPALVVGTQQVVNAADGWVRDVHTYGDTGLDETYAPTALPGEAERLYEVLHQAQRNATATDALLDILKERGLS